MTMFDRPIPGQSLTTEPKNTPYERPPEIVDPEQALQVHLARLNQPDIMDDALYFLEIGIDLVTLVEGILRSAVMSGIHTIDVSLIIAPVIHEYIKSTADLAGIKYDEGFEDKEAKKKRTYARNATLAQKKLKEMGSEPEAKPAPKQEPRVVAEDLEEMPREEPVGLMARRA